MGRREDYSLSGNSGTPRTQHGCKRVCGCVCVREREGQRERENDICNWSKVIVGDKIDWKLLFSIVIYNVHCYYVLFC